MVDIDTLIAMEARIKSELGQRKRELYAPSKKQFAFHEAGKDYRERLFRAGNQLGKTMAGAFEMACHLTGDYPAWWDGLRFDKPISAWVAGKSGQAVRDSIQVLLVGQLGQWGTGFLSSADIAEIKRGMGVSGLIDTIMVKHQSGGLSRLAFKSYDQGRERFQGATLDLAWADEEPPEPVYIELLTRTNATGGKVFMTFTPLLGMTSTVKRFLIDKVAGTTDINMTIDDVDHLTAEAKASILAQYPKHERDARLHGVPMAGSGRVFPVADEVIAVEPFAIPAHWPRIIGVDFGYDHPFAAAWLAWDRDSETVFVTDIYRIRESTPAVHCAAIRAKGEWIPVAWPHDGLQHDKGSGVALASQYRDMGANLLPTRATFADGSNGVEAGLTLMLDMMQTGRFKVFSNLSQWFEEFRLYHRENGKVVKVDDDAISATRYALMELRRAETKPAKRQSAEVYAVADEVGGY